MKITIEPTNIAVPGTPSNQINPTVVGVLPTDEITAEDAVLLFRGLLIAWGFAPETINEYFNL